MDTVTHAIIGAVTARAAKSTHEKSHDRTLLMVAALSAAFPDIDYLLFWVNPYRFITEWHRGLTHSLILLPAWAVLLSAVAFLVVKKRIPFGELFKYSCLGLFTHLAADLITVYGEELLAPFSHRRYALGLTFDIDPWIGFFALLGLVIGLQGRRNALLALIAIGAYLILMFCFHLSALSVIDARMKKSRVAVDKVYALPQPFIPFHWKLIIDRQSDYESANLSLFEKGTQLIEDLSATKAVTMSFLSLSMRHGNIQTRLEQRKTRFPDNQIKDFRRADQLRWRKLLKYGDTPKEIREALNVWRHDSFAEFRKFSTLPILYRIDSDSGSSCIWYTDLRYVFPLMTPPFRYGMCSRNSSNDWRLYRLRRNTENTRQPIR